MNAGTCHDALLFPVDHVARYGVPRADIAVAVCVGVRGIEQVISVSEENKTARRALPSGLASEMILHITCALNGARSGSLKLEKRDAENAFGTLKLIDYIL